MFDRDAVVDLNHGFFFQAEDGIRDRNVTGVQTCALPILRTFSAVIIFIFLVPYSASVYSGLASVAQVLLGISDTVFLIIIAVLSIILITFGGYLVQARADFVQGIVMMVGVVLLLIFVVRSDKVGGLAGLAEYAKTEAGLPTMNASQWVSLMA